MNKYYILPEKCLKFEHIHIVLKPSFLYIFRLIIDHKLDFHSNVMQIGWFNKINSETFKLQVVKTNR